jgi:hypothetical protein
MKTIPLTQEKIAIVDDQDYDQLEKHKWCAAKYRKTYYAFRRAGRLDANSKFSKTINLYKECYNVSLNSGRSKRLYT